MKARVIIYVKIALAAIIIGAYAISFYVGHRVLKRMSELEIRMDDQFKTDTLTVIWYLDEAGQTIARPEVITTVTGRE